MVKDIKFEMNDAAIDAYPNVDDDPKHPLLLKEADVSGKNQNNTRDIDPRTVFEKPPRL